MAGWVKVHRDIQNCWIWEDKPFSRGQAFIDLILMVNHEDKKIMFNGSLIDIKRGSGITSLRKLGDNWGWSSKKVKHFLEQLQSDKMLSYKSDSKKTLVTIENYSLYQSRDFEKKHQSDSEENQKKTKGNSEENQKKTNKNDKEYIKNDKEGEERKEVYQLQSLSFPTPLHEKIFNQFGNVTYKTWFENVSIEQTENKVIMSTSDTFKKQIIEEKYLNHIKIFEGKEVQITLKEGDSN
jgi:Fe-S cluster biosynthesis and repair protein YggX